MGLTYIGPIYGHNIQQMVTAFESASKVKEAVIVHVCTRKGKGYRPAEQNPSYFHGVSPFNLKDGSSRKTVESAQTYTDIFSETMLETAAERNDIVAVSAAMPSGTGLTGMAEKYPKQFFDVGIAEEHAVTFAAGMAAGGLKPVVAIYSTFLQRAYDQILHDVCIGKMPVVFAVDRAGLVGSDGETHQGIFDLAYLRSMPNLTGDGTEERLGIKADDVICTCAERTGCSALSEGRGVDRTAGSYSRKSQWDRLSGSAPDRRLRFLRSAAWSRRRCGSRKA